MLLIAPNLILSYIWLSLFIMGGNFQSLFVIVIYVILQLTCIVAKLPSTHSSKLNYPLHSVNDAKIYSDLNAIAADKLGAAGTSSLSASIFNLAKTILGAGVLSLPYGVAAFSDRKIALIPACILVIIMGIISAYSFNAIGSACRIHNVQSFSDAWAKSVSPSTQKLISGIVTFKTFLACLPYLIVIGECYSGVWDDKSVQV